jgi:hypothetical protein
VITASTGHRLGNVLPALYGARAVGFTDVTTGDNGAYLTTRGWDPATGLGVPYGTGLCAALKTSLVLRRPQSAMTASRRTDHHGVATREHEQELG